MWVMEYCASEEVTPVTVRAVLQDKSWNNALFPKKRNFETEERMNIDFCTTFSGQERGN